ncbi:TraB/GumN family protein [Paenibacillus sp. JW14]|uniref:TraB/GumN family protein n=2 Tax=Paenibacillus agri TaxID=2744309 RepID=A0A850EQ85_9BACL|nr:TraB/GumN family protein [Paenibacillus agri]
MSDRNVAMFERIKDYLNSDKKQTHLVAVGSGHMLGDKGIVPLLEQTGFKVKKTLAAELYPHGTAIMSTLQQVAGAIGSALAMTMLATGQVNYLRDQGFVMSNGLNLA